MTIPTGLAALSIVVLSSYALSQSIGSINNVQIYEEKAKKAADWSNAAKESLWKTRTTIGAGFVSVCALTALSDLIMETVWLTRLVVPCLLAIGGGLSGLRLEWRCDMVWNLEWSLVRRGTVHTKLLVGKAKAAASRPV